jgi:hypothetical protein
MLQHRGIAGHQRRGGEAEDLPEREIPRHDREHRSQRPEHHLGVSAVELDRLGRQERLGVRGIEIAISGALLDLRAAFGERLAHFAGHQRRELVLAPAQDRARPRHCRRPLRKARPPPTFESGAGGLRDRQCVFD